jgi:DNA-binding NtrC family response regulator
MSSRRDAPFVVVDCGAVAPSLIAAELFGHEANAFTGAAPHARPGLFEQAQGGTLFLDEVGELPIEVQPALLGAIERKRSRRIGGKQDIDHDVRIVAATHRNLKEEVRRGRFREDLYFRLAVARVRLPPLRERREDIVVLAESFAEECNVSLSAEARMLLASYDWPGNIRELRNVIMRMALAPSASLELTPEIASTPLLHAGRIRPLQEARRIASEQFEREYLQLLWRQSGGDLSRAAELAEKARQHLGRLLAKHGIRPLRE